MRSIKFTFFLYIIVFSNLFAEKNYNELYKKAEQYFYANKMAVAGSLLERIIKNIPDHKKAISLYADICLIKKEYKKALRYYNIAKEISSTPSIEYYRIGQIYYYLKNSKKSREAYLKSLTLNPKNIEAYFQLGMVSLYLDRSKENTLYYWKLFIKKSPHDSQTPKIKKVISILQNKNFKIPSKDSDISIEEALMLGGKSITADSIKTKDKIAGHEKSKNNNKIKDIVEDDDEL